MSALADQSVESAFVDWSKHLSESPSDTYQVSSLYQGEHWSVVRHLPAETADYDVQLYVISAGYGLVRLSDSIRPYAATFSHGHEDSITRFSSSSEQSACSTWWRLLCESNRKRNRQPHSIAAVAEANPGTPLLVVASSPYVAAIMSDLQLAAAQLETQQLLSILSCGLRKIPELNDSLLPCDSRMQVYLSNHARAHGQEPVGGGALWGGGSMQALNARVLRLLLQNGGSKPLTTRRLSSQLEAWTEGLDRPEKPNRRRLTDEQIDAWIRKHWAPTLSMSSLHRKLRDSKLACEQSRFRRLFREATEDLQPARPDEPEQLPLAKP